MIVARPALVRVLLGQDLARLAPRHGSGPDKSAMGEPGAPGSIKPRGRALSWGKADRT